MKTKVTNDSQRLYDLLLGARTADKVTLYFRDGRVLNGSDLTLHGIRVEMKS